MEPPGTAGAPGAAGRPWDEAKAFYDNLAPKKKPKSVRSAAVRTRSALPAPGAAGTSRCGCPRCSPPGASPRRLHLLRVALGLCSCPTSGFSGVLSGALSWLVSPRNPVCLAEFPVSSGCSGVPVGVFAFSLIPPISAQVLEEALGLSGCPHSSMASLGYRGSLWVPRVSRRSCRCWGVPGSLWGRGVLAGWLSVPGAGSRATAQGPNPCPGQGGVTGVCSLLPGSPAPGD